MSAAATAGRLGQRPSKIDHTCLCESAHAWGDERSQITRAPVEVLAGMRAEVEEGTRSLLSTLIWHPVDADVADEAGALGRRWLPSHHTTDRADLAIAATAIRSPGACSA